MKIAILLKNGPGTEEAERALQTTADMQEQGHFVSLYLLQEAVRFCSPGMKYSNSMKFQELIEKNIETHALSHDANLRGIDIQSADQASKLYRIFNFCCGQIRVEIPSLPMGSYWEIIQ